MRARLVGRVLAVAAAATVTATIGLTAGAAVAEEQGTLKYVALGDSSAAGPLIPSQVSTICLRSDKNWPNVVARRLGADLTDVSCSGATTDDMAGRQFGLVAPQYDALTADTDLVTLAIGANDIRLGTVVPSCLNSFPVPYGVSCKSRFTTGGTDELAERIAATAPKAGAVLDEINRRSPAADVFVVTYATYFAKGGCFGKDPIWGVDADYLQATWDRLHEMLAEQAAEHGARFVDIRTPSADHGVCASHGEKWMEGLVPTSAAAPYHPNAKGMAASGATVAAAIAAATL
ncbi:MAG: SGNH/GDSL hydrolase family protein [Actinophytocola sp.]|nr:SGNH/GDSL hydrolase family protein [Actinophytocola sp.]